MMVDADARYLKSHEWVKEHEGKVFSVGLSAYALEQLGDIVYIELPEVGGELKKEDAFGVIENRRGQCRHPRQPGYAQQRCIWCRMADQGRSRRSR
jgi:hypothetical protein